MPMKHLPEFTVKPRDSRNLLKTEFEVTPLRAWPCSCGVRLGTAMGMPVPEIDPTGSLASAASQSVVVRDQPYRTLHSTEPRRSRVTKFSEVRGAATVSPRKTTKNRREYIENVAVLEY